ncbi:MAG: polysaccharide biosynthesis tyrosine autokinase [Clostridia bacterium]|nr:polysaccharide biosynthesis tyrosine autokinase [Clostridia bacterium]
MNDRRASGETQEGEIDLIKLASSIWKTFRRRWYIFTAVILLAGALGGYLGTKGFRATYTSTATFIVEIDGDGTFYGQSTSKVLLAAIPQIITSRDMNELVAEKLDGKYPAARLEAEVIENTNIIAMSAVGTSSESAYYTLKTALEICPEITRHAVGKTTISYIIRPSMPASSDGTANAIRSVLIGLLVGAVVCFGVIAIYVFLFPTFDSVEEIRRRFGFEKVCSIPEIHAGSDRPFRISDKSVNRRFYDAIGRMRSSVAHEARKKDVRTILVTSTAPSEGKTTVAVNLALSLAQHGMRVLLIDCDLRNPALEDVIGADTTQTASFSEVIRGRSKLSEAIIRCGENLDVICEKDYNEDAAELITSEFVKRLMLTAREKYDFVIADTPPLTAASDASVLAEYFDAFIYVIKRGFTSVHSVEESVEQLKFCKAIPIAGVLNMSSESSSGYGYGYYGYYGGKEKHERTE